MPCGQRSATNCSYMQANRRSRSVPRRTRFPRRCCSWPSPSDLWPVHHCCWSVTVTTYRTPAGKSPVAPSLFSPPLEAVASERRRHLGKPRSSVAEPTCNLSLRSCAQNETEPRWSATVSMPASRWGNHHNVRPFAWSEALGDAKVRDTIDQVTQTLEFGVVVDVRMLVGSAAAASAAYDDCRSRSIQCHCIHLLSTCSVSSRSDVPVTEVKSVACRDRCYRPFDLKKSATKVTACGLRGPSTSAA